MVGIAVRTACLQGLAILLVVAFPLSGCGADGDTVRGSGSSGSAGSMAADPMEAERDDDDLSSTNADPSSMTDRPEPVAPPEPPVPNGTEGSIDPECTGKCVQTIIGEGSTAFDPSTSGSSSVGVDPDGALVITPGEGASGPSFIWVANTEGRVGCTGRFVSKVDTDAMVEVARYEVGFCDPSRTSVNSNGDVFVASRAGHGVTKVLAAGERCPDTNGDGVITNSTGPTDVLPLGQDDCVAWWTPLPAGDIRGIAAQDIPGETIVEEQLDGPPLVTTTEPKHYVWASGVEHNRLYKLDGDTGEILIDTQAPGGAYGAALDGNGILWMTGGVLGLNNLAFVDTNQCVDQASCDVPVCATICDAANCPGDCDGAVKGHITLPGTKYGITVDCKQRVWMAGYLAGFVQRYDHYAPAGMRFAEGGTPGGHGIAADGKGRVWVGNQDLGTVTRMDGDTMQFVDLPIPGAKGMAVDSAGKVWAVKGLLIDGGDAAHVITPGDDMNDNQVQLDAVGGFLTAYTYSDMTGQQLRLASREPSVYVQNIDTCQSSGMTALTEWRNLTWDAELPPGSYIVFRVRVGQNQAEAEQQAWIEVAAVPGRDSPHDILPFLEGAAQQGRFIQVEISLVSPDGNQSSNNACGGTAGTTPRLKSFGVSYTCPPLTVE